MGQLSFPISADGLKVDVRVNLPSAALAALHASGQPVPWSIAAKGLIDTGTDISAVAPSIFQQLRLRAQSHQKTQGVTGAAQVGLFYVTLFIVDSSQLQLPWFTLPDLLVMELPTVLPVEVLIGMDVLRMCKLLVDGPANQFWLDF
jgi:predicted aspartyl protease